MKPLVENSWTAGTCIGQVGPRSYEVRVGDSVYRRNHRDLITAGELPIIDIPDSSENSSTQPAPHLPEAAIAPASTSAPQVVPPQTAQPSLHQSQRHRKPPNRLKDYVPK